MRVQTESRTARLLQAPSAPSPPLSFLPSSSSARGAPAAAVASTPTITDAEFIQLQEVRHRFAQRMSRIVTRIVEEARDARELQAEMQAEMDLITAMPGQARPADARHSVETFEPLPRPSQQWLLGAMATYGSDLSEEAASVASRVYLYNTSTFQDVQQWAANIALACATSIDRMPSHIRLVRKERQHAYATHTLKISGLPNPLPEGWHPETHAAVAPFQRHNRVIMDDATRELDIMARFTPEGSWVLHHVPTSAEEPMMIGVPTHGIYFGHSMPPSLPNTPKLNIYTKI
jgi:hypothetical protein